MSKDYETTPAVRDLSAPIDDCLSSQRVDGPYHAWAFDGDDPRVQCSFCGEVRDAHTEQVLRPGARRILDVEEARTAALREHAHRYPNEIVNVMGFAYRRMTGADVSSAFAAYEALPPADDGPGYDQHGTHERDAYTGPTVSVTFDEVLLAAADEQLEKRLDAIFIEREQNYRQTASLSRREAVRRVIADVRAEARYTDRLTLPAELVEAGWQILNSRDEETWHDIAEVVDCADPGCAVRKTIDAGEECIVLVGAAWADGFAHFPTTALVDVRIPAGER